MSEGKKSPKRLSNSTKPRTTKAEGTPKKSTKTASKDNQVVSLLCPVCDKPYKIARKMLGKEIECKDCGRNFVLKDPKAEAKKAKKKSKPKVVRVDDTYEANCKVCESDTTHKFNHCTVCGLTEVESGKIIDAGVTKLKSTIAVLIYILIAFGIYWKNPDDRRGLVRPDENNPKGIHERSYKNKETFLEKWSDTEKR
jgi:hypothetical protein